MTSQKASVPAPLVFSEGVAKSKKVSLLSLTGSGTYRCWTTLSNSVCNVSSFVRASLHFSLSDRRGCRSLRLFTDSDAVGEKKFTSCFELGAVPPLTGLPVEESILLDGCEGGRAGVGLDSPFTDSCYRPRHPSGLSPITALCCGGRCMRYFSGPHDHFYRFAFSWALSVSRKDA